MTSAAPYLLIALARAARPATPPSAQGGPPCGDELCRLQLRPPAKDVMRLPTPDAMVSRMLAAARTTSRDLVHGLGAGDFGSVRARAAGDALSGSLRFAGALTPLDGRRRRRIARPDPQPSPGIPP